MQSLRCEGPRELVERIAARLCGERTRMRQEGIGSKQVKGSCTLVTTLRCEAQTFHGCGCELVRDARQRAHRARSLLHPLLQLCRYVISMSGEPGARRFAHVPPPSRSRTVANTLRSAASSCDGSP